MRPGLHALVEVFLREHAGRCGHAVVLEFGITGQPRQAECARCAPHHLGAHVIAFERLAIAGHLVEPGIDRIARHDHALAKRAGLEIGIGVIGIVAQIDRRNRAVVLGIGARHAPAQVGGDIPLGSDAHGREIGLVVDLVEGGDADAERIGNRQVDRGLGADIVEAAILHAGAATQVAPRIGGVDVDHAGRGIAAIDRALRPAQHFDRCHVEHRHAQRGGKRVVDAVDLRGDGGIAAEAVVAADAADGKAVLRQLERGHRGSELFARGQPLAIEQALRHHADGDRRLADALAALLRGNDDFGGRLVGHCLGRSLRGGCLRQHRRGQGEGQDAGRAEQDGAVDHAFLSLVGSTLPRPGRRAFVRDSTLRLRHHFGLRNRLRIDAQKLPWPPAHVSHAVRLAVGRSTAVRSTGAPAGAARSAPRRHLRRQCAASTDRP